MDDHWLPALTALEREIVRYDDPPPTGASGLAILPGHRPVLLSAPHAVRHRRDGLWKREDEYTAAIVHWLHERLGVHALYPTHRIDPDPHDDDDQGAYKQAVRDLVQAHDIRLVLDVHGARGDRDFALALGSIYGETCAPYETAIIRAFEMEGFHTNSRASSLDRIAINPSRYAGGARRPTVTRFVWQQLGVPAMQIEINAWARVVARLPESYEALRGVAPDFRGDPARIRRVLSGLMRIVEAVTISPDIESEAG